MYVLFSLVQRGITVLPLFLSLPPPSPPFFSLLYFCHPSLPPPLLLSLVEMEWKNASGRWSNVSPNFFRPGFIFEVRRFFCRWQLG